MVASVVCAIAAAGLGLSAAPNAAAGSVADPELSDPAGDIRYSPLTPDEGGHEYIDVLAAFAAHATATDRVNLSLVLVDTSALEGDIGDWRAACSMSVDIVRGGGNVTLDVVFEKDGSGPIEYDAFLQRGGSFETLDAKDYDGGMSFGQKGIANWSFAAGFLRSLGDRATNFDVGCSTLMRAAGAPTLVTHSDDAVGTKDYTIPAAPPSSSDPFNPADDLPDGHRGNQTDGEGGEGSESPGISAIGIVLVVVACGVTLAARRRD